MGKDWIGDLRAVNDSGDVMLNSANDNVALVYHKYSEDRLPRGSYIAKCVNEAPAKEARIAELEALLEECRPFVGDAHADHIEYMGGHVNYERDLSRLDGLLARIDAALKGEK